MSAVASSDWRATKVKFLGEVVSGGTPQSTNPDYWNGPVPWLTPVDLGKNGSDAIGDSVRTVTNDGVAAAGLDILPPGSIVISTRAPIGSVGLLTCEATTNQGCKSIVPNARKLNSRFAYYFAISVADELRSLGLGTTFVELSTYSLKNLPLTIPAVQEQRRIAAYLDEQTAKIDRLMDLRRRQMELLKEQRAALIQQAVTRGLNPDAPMKDSGLPWLGEIPAHWEVKPLKWCIRAGTSISYGIVQPGDQVVTGVPFIQSTDISKEPLDVTALQRVAPEIADAYPRSRLCAGDVILGIRASIGNAHALGPEFDGVNLSRGIARIATNPLLIVADFLVAYLRTSAVMNAWNLVSQGSTFSEVSIANVRKLAVVVPPLEEQCDILRFAVMEFAKFDGLLSAYSRQLDLLAEYRASLIHECVTGERWVGEET